VKQTTSPHIQQFLATPAKSFFFLWIPVLFSMVAEPLTGLVDTAFVARLGTEHLAALGVGTVVMSSCLWLFNFLSVGSQTEVSQALGRGQLQQGRKIASLALILGLSIGCLLSLVVFLLAPQVATLMGASDAIHQYAVTYIKLRAFGGPAVLMSMISFGILYGLGDMRTPLCIAVGVNVVNLCLDAWFIFGAGPVPPLGIAGAAIASSISQILGAICCIFLVYRKLGFTADINLSDIGRLFTIGRDMLFRTGSLILFLLLATRLATGIGPDSGAVHQAIRQVWVFCALFLDATAVVAQSIIGFYFGAGEIARARKVAKLVCGWSFFIGLCLMFFMFVVAGWVEEILVPSVGGDLFLPCWVVTSLFQPIAAIAFVTDGIHWGTGDFRYLRNVVIFATLCSIASLWFIEYSGFASLILIWWITGGWIVVRAVFGILRIWPGSLGSPLADPSSH
jgi:MATE family, multidrug efflux pump